eukprot:715076-Pelagomonas_calceolata.AAC.2
MLAFSPIYCGLRATPNQSKSVAQHTEGYKYELARILSAPPIVHYDCWGNQLKYVRTRHTSFRRTILATAKKQPPTSFPTHTSRFFHITALAPKPLASAHVP